MRNNLRRITLLTFCLALAACAPAPQGEKSDLPAPARPVPPPVGSIRELLDLRALPAPKPWRVLQAAGYDRGDGFYDSGNFIRIEPGRRCVLMDAEGPGCIDRIWITIKTKQEPYDFLLYVDDNEKPVINTDLDRIFDGSLPRFPGPLAGRFDRARYSFVPITFRKSCRIVVIPTAPDENYQWRENTAGEKIRHFYYQLTWRKFPAGTELHPYKPELDSREAAAVRRIAELWDNCGAWPWGEVPGLRDERKSVEARPGGYTTVWERKGPGTVLGLQMRVPDPDGLHLQMFWDGDAKPAVSAPLGTFFASPDNTQEVRGLWLGCVGGEQYCHLPMPFRKGARIVVRSSRPEPANVDLRVRHLDTLPYRDDAYFHANAYDCNPPTPGKDYVILETKGRGHLVGVMMDNIGHMEGDERFYVDGEEKPSVHGTGTEDFFNFAWGLKHIGTLPLHGMFQPHKKPAAYRFFCPAGVPFTSSLRAGLEHGHGNEDQKRYSGVSYYYLHRD